MKILKRDGKLEIFKAEKIEIAINKAFKSINSSIDKNDLDKIITSIKNFSQILNKESQTLSVEKIQDMVEEILMSLGYYRAVKSYIVYRDIHFKNRLTISDFKKHIDNIDLINLLKNIQRKYDKNYYNLDQLYHKFNSLIKKNSSFEEKLDNLIKSSVELTSKESPDWEFIASKLLSFKLNIVIDKNCDKFKINTFYDKITYLTEKNLYGKYILENYSKEDTTELSNYIKNINDELLTYSSLDLLYKRYMIKDKNDKLLESPQEMFMGISMHLAIPEKENKIYWAKKIYDNLSSLKITMATPTMSNARKPYHQLSSCFIDTVPDTLKGIYRSIDNFAQISKYGGGMGLYFGKVRAIGSDIRGFKGVAGGVTRWIKLANDTAVAVDQLGVRQGSVSVYLDVWHKDLLEFLQLRTNNGDDRMKAHDIFTAICYPDYFWEIIDSDIESTWYMMCPYEIKKFKGYSLEDTYGNDWKIKYLDCVNDERISKRKIVIKDLIRLILKSVTETGTPFAFNRDHVNKLNPNKHKGMIYSSNLCTEIAQNMSPISSIETKIITENNEEVVVSSYKPGDFVVCNLASLVLNNIKIENELEEVVETAVKALDNVIDLNYYPTPYAKITNKNYRAIGLGTSGYHSLLVKNNLKWESNEHLEYVDKLYEDINYFAIKASNKISIQKGSYKHFENSDWENGNYFDQRLYNSSRWNNLRENIKINGIRNGYLLAVAPTGSTSIIAGTTASTDPVMDLFFMEEKKGSIIPRVAPNLTLENFSLYKSAHTIDQTWSVKAAGIRQKHIDQAQSLNIYITTDYTMRQILELYILAWKNKVKTIYYIRSKSLEVENCEVCSA
ncbi:MAG: ribonucleoside-diphosphate reductase subunit alpha [Clostridiales bacterium]